MLLKKLQKYQVVSIVVVSVVLFVSSGSFAAQEYADKLSEAFREAIKEVKPAVVSISAEKKIDRSGTPDIDNIPDIFKPFIPKEFRNMPMNPKRDWQGSGVIISPEGEILTNYHVVKDADKLQVTLDDGREIDADMSTILTDPGSDIAIFKLEKNGKYPYAELGDSDDMKVGDWVLAIGNPFGLAQTVTQGIISAKGRNSSDVQIGGNEFYIKDYIQTSASINPGNSGGALINLNGEVIGINNAIQTAGAPGNLGIGFAIPSNLAISVIDSLKEFGKVKRGYIGVGLGNLEEDNLDEWYKQEFDINQGALVQKVYPDTPAEKAGIQEGDLIILFNGTKVINNGHLINMVTSTPVGSEVELTVLRRPSGNRKNITLVLEERPELADLPVSLDLSERLLGVTVKTLTDEDASEMGLDEKKKGVLVTKVLPGSSAEDVGISSGSIIDEINDKPIKNKDDFENALDDIVEKMKEKDDDERVILLHIYRADNRFPEKWIAPTIRLDDLKEEE
jgi:serine protease Do